MTFLVIATALPAVVAAILGVVNRKKIQEVHVLVNSQLSEVVASLKQRTEERDKLQAEKEIRDKA